MSKEKFIKNKKYPNLQEIADRIFARKTEGMSPEEKKAYEENEMKRLIYAAYGPYIRTCKQAEEAEIFEKGSSRTR